ncbi:MAG: hypothetical protein ACK4IX_04310, partial [Candidatus Sericytochromatia bacterium]
MHFLNKYNIKKALKLALTTSLAFNVLIPAHSFAEDIVLEQPSVSVDSSSQVTDSNIEQVPLSKEQEDSKNFVSKYTVDMSSIDKKDYIFDNIVTSVIFSSITGRMVKLYSNDEEVSSDRLGKTQIDRSTGMTSFAYFGVPLKVGKNEIRLVEYNQDLQPIREIVKDVYVRGSIASIDIEKIYIPADSKTVGKVSITLKDKWENPADDRGFITVKLDKGIIKSEDKDPTSAGIQLKSENGKAELLIVGTNQVDTANIQIESSLVVKSSTIDFTTPYREPILVGVAKTNGNYKFLSGKLLQGDDKKAGFNFGLGGSIFAQGTIFNDFLLTLSASDKKLNSLDDDENVLMRDVNEQRRYPIYGDSSQLDQVATANSNVFFKLEKDKSSLMWGDFTTGQTNSDNNSPRMTVYNRVMTGAKLALNIPKITNLELFGAASQQNFERDEIRGAGVSGPYYTSKFPMVNGSETIKIETRDRVLTGKILETKSLSRLTDYNIDYS